MDDAKATDTAIELVKWNDKHLLRGIKNRRPSPAMLEPEGMLSRTFENSVTGKKFDVLFNKEFVLYRLESMLKELMVMEYDSFISLMGDAWRASNEANK